MTSEPNTKILLVCDNEAYISNIKLRLEELIKAPCYVWHSFSLSEGLNYLNQKKLRANIIILDLGLIGTDNPKAIYKKMGEAAHGIPIIVLTDKGQEEHDLATFVMEAGAADHMIRGEFSRLADAIEFALIRHRLANKLTAEALNKSSSSQQIRQDAHDGELKAAKTKSDEKNEKNKQYISWITGGYSFDNSSEQGT